MSSPKKVLVLLEEVQFHKKYTGRLNEWLTEVEENAIETSSNLVWKQKFLDLEKQHKKVIKAYRTIHARNEELEGLLNRQKPDLDNAVAARESAFRKLKHARKVIRDLLDERGDMHSPRHWPRVTNEAIREALGDEPIHNRSSPSTPHSDPTIRRQTPAPTIPATSPHIPRPIRAVPFNPQQMVASSSKVKDSSSPRGKPSPAPALAKQSSLAPSSSFKSSRPSPAYTDSLLLSPESDEAINVHYQVPSTYQVLRGPYSKEKLHQDLDLSISDADALNRISAASGLGMKLHITQSASGEMMVFLYSPAFIEGSKEEDKKCHAIEWDYVENIGRLKERVESRKRGQDIMHTFTCFNGIEDTESGRYLEGWYYLGPMEWKEVDDQYFMPPDEDKARIIRELAKRTKKTLSKEKLRELMDSDAITPIGIRLQKVEDTSITDRFLAQHDGLCEVSPEAKRM